MFKVQRHAGDSTTCDNAGMPRFLTLCLTALPILAVIDLLWLGVVASRFYRESLGDLFAPEVNWMAAGLFYVIFIAGLTFFAIGPAIEARSIGVALGRGAFLGLLAYATYDLTNLAVIRNWPVLMSVVDIAWGTLMSAVVASLTYWVATAWWKM
jgi:uncharacterized membrane protein